MKTDSKPIDLRHKKKLEIILMDKRILKDLHIDGAIAKRTKVHEDGSISVGKYKYGWMNEWFNSYYTISFFELVSRISFIITGGESNNCDNDGLVGFITEAIDKVLKKDEKEKVIDIIFYYCDMLDPDSPMKLSYDVRKDSPSFTENTGNKKRQRMVGCADAVIDFGYDKIPIKLHVVED